MAVPESDPVAQLKAIAKTCRNPVLRERATRQHDLAQRGVKPPPIREYLSTAIMIVESEIAAKWSKLGWEYAKGPNDWNGSQEPTPWVRDTGSIILVQCHAIAIVPHAHMSDLRVFTCEDADQAAQEMPPADLSIPYGELEEHDRELIFDFLEKTNSADWLEGTEDLFSTEPTAPAKPLRIETQCPHCGETLYIREKYIGTRGRCKYCKEKFTVPDPADST